ncbi:MAG TPA: beta-glucuronidase [Ruminococcus sp.]|nr:beta-glucuronidase [Ruminococcus sp.]
MIQRIELDGKWLFLADQEKKYTGFLPERSSFQDTIHLPATTAQEHKGIANQAREIGFLTEVYPYMGNAWFLREIEIPRELQGKRVQLFLERTRVTSVWVNGHYIGSQNSLCTPHCYDVTAFSGSEKLTICICVDNVQYMTAGGHMTSPDTQTNWNGITGEISLRFYETDCIKSVKAVPDYLHKRVTFQLKTEGNVHTVKAEGEWFDKNGLVSPIASKVLFVDPKTSSAIMTFGDDVPLWDEYHPVLCKIRLRPYGSKDETEVTFGMTDFKADGDMFTSNGRPVFLRGKHDGMVFPLVGAAPTNVEEWLRVMEISKSYGINHYRFHTCCPPEAAFEAADLLGIYLEPEIPFWGSLPAPAEEGYIPAEQEYLIEEGKRILETFGNHPSFCMFSLGNELWGNPQRMGEIIRYYKKNENRILFTQGSNNFQFWPNILPEDDFFVGVRLSEKRLIRGSFGACDQPYGHVQTERPSSDYSYDAIIRPEYVEDAENEDAPEEIEIQYGTGVKRVQVNQSTEGLIPNKPIITHEIGQYAIYPNFEEIPKYIGVLQARNFEVFKERLEEQGMEDKAKDFFTCSGMLAVQCYKEELESAMRSEYISGFQILDIQDFTGQGTATVGILDAFMDSKGLITPEEWRGFCSDSVILGIFPDYCITDLLSMQVKLRYYKPEPVQDKLHYVVERGKQVLKEGTIAVDVNGQGLFDIGEISVGLPTATKVHRIDVKLTLGDTENHYTFWQFPQQEMPEMATSGTLTVTADWEEAKTELEKGRNVLFLPNELQEYIPGFYCSDFWCYPMFYSIAESMGKEPPVGTMGLCIDKRHPAVKQFKPESWSTPQWYDIVSNADLAILDGTEIQPIVQMIDNFERNHKLGLLFECKVGQGSLLVCTARLSDASDRMEVRQFARGLMDYASSADFMPTAKATVEELDEILR